MSARLASRKARPYASFVAVAISRARLSGCAVRIFSNSKEVSYVTNSDHKPNTPMLSTPATCQFRALVDGGPIAIQANSALYAKLAKPLFARFYAKLLIPPLGT